MKKLVLFAFILFSLGACTEPPPPMLTSKDRNIVDSLSKLKAKELKPFYDSLCDATFDQEVEKAIDSIMRVRLVEIAKQKERIKQKGLQ